MKRRRPYVVQHFANGLLAIVGETKPGRVSLCILGSGNPSGSLRASGTPAEMGRLAQKLARVCVAANQRRKP